MKRFGRNFECSVAACSLDLRAPNYRIVSWRWLYIRYSSVTIACMGLQSLWEIVFFPRPKVGRWLSGIDGTVGPPQQLWDSCFTKRRLHSCTSTSIW